MISAEETGGPTATVEITTFEPEAQLELPFDSDEAYVRHQPYSLSFS